MTRCWLCVACHISCVRSCLCAAGGVVLYAAGVAVPSPGSRRSCSGIKTLHQTGLRAGRTRPRGAFAPHAQRRHVGSSQMASGGPLRKARQWKRALDGAAFGVAVVVTQRCSRRLRRRRRTWCEGDGGRKHVGGGAGTKREARIKKAKQSGAASTALLRVASARTHARRTAPARARDAHLRADELML